MFLVCFSCVVGVFVVCFWCVLACFWCVFGVFLVCKLRGEMGEGGGGRGVSVGEPRGGFDGGNQGERKTQPCL